MVETFKEKAPVYQLCSWLDLATSSYYYHPGFGKRGAKPSTHTLNENQELVPNETVVEDIRRALNREFCRYGYRTITDDLQDMGYVINHKKVYGLMDRANLLLGKIIKTRGKRRFVQHRKIQAQHPMEYICLDIKYIWVSGDKRNYYLLSIMDVFSRLILEQIFQPSIRKKDVINLFRRINSRFGIKGVIVRNDNGSQFIANDVKAYLKSQEAEQEFTHIATPEENAYIEAFHSIVQREVVDRFEFESFYQTKLIIESHCIWYNSERKHVNLGKITPVNMWNAYYLLNNQKNFIFGSSDEADAGSAGEQPARNKSGERKCHALGR
jgi:transposase InsO family protein